MGVQLVTLAPAASAGVSDAHEGLKAAIGQTLVGASWQRCRVHFTLTPLRVCASAGVRKLLAHISQGDRSLVAATVRTIFAQPSREAARAQVAQVAHMLDQHWPKATTLLRSAESDISAYMSFPREHRTRIYSTNPLERFNREVKRRTDVVQVFPNDDAALRLAGAILLETADEWAADERHYFG